MRPKLNTLLLLVVGVCWAANVCRAQTAPPRVARAEALKAVKVVSLDGWRESVSDAGRFRILFRGEPEPVDEPIGTGFEMRGGGLRWVALYSDFDQAEQPDDAALRRRYRESAEAAAGRRSKLLLVRDVTLNGRLGVEYAHLGREAKIYMRAFVVGRRLYTLAVEDRRDLSEAAAFPAEVQNFFDSFTFWD